MFGHRVYDILVSRYGLGFSFSEKPVHTKTNIRCDIYFNLNEWLLMRLFRSTQTFALHQFNGFFWFTQGVLKSFFPLHYKDN